MLKKNLQLIKEKKYGNKFIEGDILNLPFLEQKFDSVWAIAALHMIPSKELRKRAVGEIKRVLKPGGLMVLTVPFGKALVNNQQRVYDKKGLDTLLSGFLVKEIKFFKNTQVVEGNNYWEQITLMEAESLHYISGTECVCCLSALKDN